MAVHNGTVLDKFVLGLLRSENIKVCRHVWHGKDPGLACETLVILARLTEIDRRYKLVDGMWLDDRLESISDVLIAGRSSLTIQYSYESIRTDPQHGSANSASLIATPPILPPGRPTGYVKPAMERMMVMHGEIEKAA